MVVPFGGSYLGSYMVIPKGTTMEPVGNVGTPKPGNPYIKF